MRDIYTQSTQTRHVFSFPGLKAYSWDHDAALTGRRRDAAPGTALAARQ
jgi:hypothetical protein